MKSNDDNLYPFTGFEHGFAYYLLEGWSRREAAIEVTKNIKRNTGKTITAHDAFQQARQALANKAFIQWLSKTMRNSFILEKDAHANSPDELSAIALYICTNHHKNFDLTNPRNLEIYQSWRRCRRQLKLLLPEDRNSWALLHTQFHTHFDNTKHH